MKARANSWICCSWVIVLGLVGLANGSYKGIVDYRKFDQMSDEQIQQVIDALKPEYDQLRPAFLKAKERLEAAQRAFVAKDGVSAEARWKELNDATEEYTKIADIYSPIARDVEWLTQILEERAKIPPETKEYEQLRQRLRPYQEGEGTREELVAAFCAFAKKYPDKPVGVQALYDAAMLYVNNWRKKNEEPYEPCKAKEILKEIVDTYPDLLDRYVVWARNGLTYLCPNSPDEHFRNRLAHYRWTLTGIRPEQYAKTIEWMRRDYHFRDASDEYLMGQIRGMFRNIRYVERINLAGLAEDTSDPNGSKRLLEEVLAEEARLEGAAREGGLEVHDANGLMDSNVVAASMEAEERRRGPLLPGMGLGYGIGIVGLVIVGAAALAAFKRSNRDSRSTDNRPSQGNLGDRC